MRAISAYIITPIICLVGALALDIAFRSSLALSNMFCGIRNGCPRFPFSYDIFVSYLLFLIINFLLALLLLRNWKRATVSCAIYLLVALSTSYFLSLF